MYCISDPQILLGLSGRLRKDFSHCIKCRGNRIHHTRTLPPSPLHGKIFLSPNISLQHSSKNAENIHWQIFPAFLQCGRHTKFGTIFGLSIPDLQVNCLDLCDRVHHFLYAKLTELGAEDLASRVLTEDAISEVTQCDFNIEEITVTPKHARLPSNK